MKILIYTAMNKRHNVSRLWAIGIKRFIDAAPEGVECTVLVVASEDESVPLCKEFGFEIHRAPNSPLGKKFNSGLQYAMEKLPWDYCLLFGDDDLISSEAWAHYLPVMQQGYPYFGFNSIYFYSPGQQKARLFSYAMQGCPDKLIGCGRGFRRDILDHVCWNATVMFRAPYTAGGCAFPANTKITMPVYKADYLNKQKVAEIHSEQPYFAFWKDEQQKGLDNESEIRLLMNGFQPYVIETDVKTGMNLWGYDHFISMGQSALIEEAVAFMGYEERNFIAENLQADETEIKLREEKLTMPDIMLVGDTPAELIGRKAGEILDKVFEQRFNRPLKTREKITMVPFKDHPNYVEYWENWPKDHRKFVCGLHITQDKKEVTFSIVEKPEMSKAQMMLVQ
jgi:glycosyltransferase involved in cell wall biosynthesis